jgi:hypothetical protein
LTKEFEFENSAKQEELLDGVGQFQDEDQEHQHRIDILVTGFTLQGDEIVMKTHLRSKEATN